MADTFTKNLNLTLMELGSRTNDWKTEFDAGFGAPIDLMAGEKRSLSFASADQTMVEADYQAAVIECTGALTASRALIMPTATPQHQRWQVIRNLCTRTTANNTFVLQARTQALTAVDLPFGVSLVHFDGIGAPTVMPIPSYGISNPTPAGAVMDIGSAVNDDVNITTGGLSITTLGTAPAGVVKRVRFNAAGLTLQNVAALILPGGANIAVASGDSAFFLSLGSGNWQCLSYQLGNGLALPAAVATTAEIWAGTATKLIQNDVQWAALAVQNVAYAATVTLDFAAGINFAITPTLTGNLSLRLTNVSKVGQSGWIRLAQDVTGSRLLTLDTTGGIVWWSDNNVDPVLTTTASGTDYLFYNVLAANSVYVSLARRVG